MSRLSAITSKATLREYAQGAAQTATQPIADFLAPTVNVSAPAGYYKQYTEKSRFSVPESLRAINGNAVQLGWDAVDKRFDCQPHALDIPLDNLEILAEESVVQEAAQMAAEVGALSHELAVSRKALAALTATDTDTTVAGFDFIQTLDQNILSVIKAAKYGSLMGVGILFGAGAFVKFKNHKSVTGKFTVGVTAKGLIAPKVEDVGGLLVGGPEARVSMMVYDSAKPGSPEDINFVLDNQILIFARHPNPTRRDPSFMKTFRLASQWMVPGTYEKPDGRGEVIKMDWSEDVQITNTAAAQLLDIA